MIKQVGEQQAQKHFDKNDGSTTGKNGGRSGLNRDLRQQDLVSINMFSRWPVFRSLAKMVGIWEKESQINRTSEFKKATCAF